MLLPRSLLEIQQRDHKTFTVTALRLGRRPNKELPFNKNPLEEAMSEVPFSKPRYPGGGRPLRGYDGGTVANASGEYRHN